MNRSTLRWTPAFLLFATVGLTLIALDSKLVNAQINRPSASPRVQVTQQISLITATLDYGRPGVKGRKIFGELEPYGKVWRTGANASTKISFSGQVKVGKTTLPAGDYALYTIPGKKSWTVIFSKSTNLWGAGGYKQSNDALRIDVPVKKLKTPAESLSIDFERFHANGADLFISWERSKIVVPVHVDSDATVLAEIDQKIKKSDSEPSAQTFFDAGMFYYEKDVDLRQAEAWIERAVELKPDAFWFVYYQAELAHAMGQKAKAKKCVGKALKAAKASSADFGYIAKCTLLMKKL